MTGHHRTWKVLARTGKVLMPSSTQGDRPAKLAVPVVLFVLAIVVAAVMSPITSVPSTTPPGSTGGVTSHPASGGKPSLRHTQLASVSAGSWAIQHDGFATTGISCPSTTVCFAVGNVSEGGAFTEMNGAVWSTPTLVSGVATFSGISCPGLSTCFATGESTGSSPAPVVEETTNSGAGWSSWTPTTSTGTITSVSSISCPATSECSVGGVALGDPDYDDEVAIQMSISVSTITGTTSSLGSGGSPVSVSCANATNCALSYGDGSNNPNIFIYGLNSGGTLTWSRDSATPTNAGSLNGISCLPNSGSVTCVAVGYCYTVEGCSQDGSISITTNDGASWVSGGSVGMSLSAVSCGATTECATVGLEDKPYAYTYIDAASISVTGDTWSPAVPAPEDSDYQDTVLSTITCASATECFIGGSFGLEEATDGVHFHPVELGVPALTQVSCGSATDCLAVTGPGGLAATDDGGRTWINLPPIVNNNCSQAAGFCDSFDSVACYSGSGCIAQGTRFEYSSEANPFTMFTTDLGLVLTGIASGATTFGCAIGTSTCAGITPSSSTPWQASLSTTGGSSWASTAGALSVGNSAAISCGSSTMCVAVGDTRGTPDAGAAELFTESGSTWTATAGSMGSTGPLTSVSCPTAGMCMAAGPSGVVALGAISGTSVTFTSLTGTSGIPSGSSNAPPIACDSATSCSIFNGTAGAVSTTSGSTTTFAPISGLSLGNGSIAGASCGGNGTCFAVGSVYPSAAVILATNGLTSPAWLPPGLIAADTFGGPDGSQPCLACALKQMGYAATGFAAEPINTADGDFYETVPLVSIPGLGPNLSFTATYDSQLAQSQVANGITYPGPLGFGWSMSDYMTLAGAGGTGNVTVNEEGGAQISYQPSATGPGVGGGSCTTSPGVLQCYQSTQGDVTAELEGITAYGAYFFTRNNWKTTYVFNATGALGEISDSNGHVETFAYGVTTGANCSAAGTACIVATDASGRSLDIVYNLTFQIQKVVDPAGRTWNFTYDSNRDLTGIQNPRSLNETFGYDTGSVNPTMVHNMTSVVSPNGQSDACATNAGVGVGCLSIAYEESSTSTTAPLGYVISQIDPAGEFTAFSYAGSNMAPTGGATTITTCTIPAPYTSTPSQCATPTTSPIMSQSEDQYVNGVLIGHVAGLNTALPAQTSFVRNAQDMPITVLDPDGHVFSATYDSYGNMLTSTDASNNEWIYQYNQFNQVLTAKPPTGSTQPETVNVYDADGNLQTATQQPTSGPALTTTYYYSGSPAGLPSSVKDPKGNATSYTYDSYGDLASSTDAMGNKTTYAYTTVGQRYCSTSPKATAAGVACPSSPATRVANTTSETFDSSDTLVASTTDPNGGTSNYTYDYNGNLAISEDPAGTYTLTGFDADNRPSAVYDGFDSSSQTETTTAYDVPPSSSNPNCSTAAIEGELPTSCTDVTQAAGSSIAAVTASYYDAFGNLIQTTDPGGKTTVNTYDPVGNLITTTTGGGTGTGAGTTTYGYQPNNWRSTETFSAPGSGFTSPSPVSFTYYPDGVRHTMADATGTTTYGYDPYGRLDSVVDGAGKAVTYGYDAASNLTCLSYPNSGSTNCQNASSGTGIVAYGYDTDNRMNSMEDWNGQTTSFNYDADSNWNSTSFPTTVSTSVAETYGNADNLTNETTTNANLSGGSQSTTWTPNADELFATTKANSGTAEAYGYNSLTQATSLAGSDTYAYNQLGQMTTDTPASGAATDNGYTTDEALCFSGTATGTCASPPSGATRYGTNALNGRCYATTSTTSGSCTAPPTGSTTQSYGYDQLGDLTCATAANPSSYTCSNTNASKTTTYTYNGDGLRMSDTPAGSSAQQFTWDVSPSVPDLVSDGTNSYLYGPGGTPVEQIVTSTSTPSFLVSDPTGVRYQFSAAGTLSGSKAYNPYGKCTTCTATTPLGFEDAYTDPNGLLYLVHRYYDPTTGQFLTVDPLVARTGQPFAFANDDPVNLKDPSGEDWADALKAFATACAQFGFLLHNPSPLVVPEQPAPPEWAVSAPGRDPSSLRPGAGDNESSSGNASNSGNGQTVNQTMNQGQALEQEQQDMDEYGMGEAFDESLDLEDGPEAAAG